MNHVFIGDSITEGFPFSEFFPSARIKNQGIWGTSTAEIIGRMEPEWFLPVPEKVFVCAGTNDLAREISMETIVKNLESMGRKINDFSGIPSPQIYLCSVFPTRNNLPRPNGVIDRLNIALHKCAAESGWNYLHLNPFFKDKEGQLAAEFTNDGLHLSPEGYRLWAHLIQSLILL